QTSLSNHYYIYYLDFPTLACFSLNDRLFFDRTLLLYRIIMKFFCFFFSLFVELANGFILDFFFTNSFLSVLPHSIVSMIKAQLK
uniref:Uncharacterized protein n=1 Tax=Varanus komodoensis TaxID=61221 RepID=A0A8D2LZ65_VARKO